MNVRLPKLGLSHLSDPRASAIRLVSCLLFLFPDSNRRNLSATLRQAHNFHGEQRLLNTHSQAGGAMTTIFLVGVAGFLAAIAIIVKARAGKPKKPERWEKAQILKQLLARSEREDLVNGISRQQSVSQNPTPRSRSAVANTSPSRTVRPA